MTFLTFSLRARIFLSMIVLLIITFVLTGAILFYHFARENEEYHSERIKRKEYAVRANIDYFLTPYKDGVSEKEIPEMFTDKICEIADIHNVDIAIYSVSGYLLISSNEDMVNERIIPLKLAPATLYRALNRENRLERAYRDSVEYASTFSVIYNNNNRPLAVVSLPYYMEASRLQETDMRFLYALGSIYVVLFIGAVFLAYVLSNYISASLNTVREHLRHIRLNGRNEQMVWNGDDEIGQLVKEYNRMVQELEKSAVLLAKSERESAWKEMARQVAHEVKNPLTPMRLMVQYLDKTLKTEEPEKLHEHTQTMIDQIDAMSSIAEAFSRFADMPEYNMTQVNLTETLNRATSFFPSLHIKLNLPEQDIYTSLDKELWVRVLNNLIKNAWQAIPEDRLPEIEIGLKQENNDILVWVKDNGVGIEAAQHDQIFEPRFTTKNTGMGMGLAIVKTIVEGLGGTIWVASETGKGATFFINLKREEEA